ncbi:MAG: polysaccharide biosynthesis C-terminal domain-containing protein [Pyrinomonadaceae bacterium]|nr:polysaccharide biosynthesis C-terminal domain-containing protein [Sphingobacteriaceae bacterium]
MSLKKQGFFNSITLYMGIALGFFNSIILFQRYLTLEEIGYFNLLIGISVIYTQITSLGVTNVIIRYFPFFKTHDKKHAGFPLFIFSLCSISFIVVTLCFFIFKEIIFNYNSDSAGISLMSKYYHYIVPISFFTLIFLLQETFARANFINVFPAVLREVLLRVFTSIAILLIASNWINFNGFIIIYLLANILIVVILSYYNHRLKIFNLAQITPKVHSEVKVMMNYGIISMLGGSALSLLPIISMLTLKMINGEAAVGIFGTFFSIAAVISLPAKALNTTSYQIISNAWKEEDLKKISSIYSKTSLVQLLIGGLLLIGLIVNQKNILYLLHKPDYGNFFSVFIILSCGFLIDITGGLNGAIVGFSKHYKIQTRILISATVICFFINIAMVSKFGLVGAAWSYLLTFLFLNFSYWLYIKLKFNIQPFGKKHALIIIIGAFALIVGLNLPNLTNYYFDVAYRSIIVTIVYGALAYWFAISEDVNDLLNKLLKRLF